MSRNSKEVKIGDKIVTIYELTVRDIRALWKDITGADLEKPDMPFFSNEAILKKHWDKCVHGLKLEETEDLVPSELKFVYDAFSEVNAIFFDLTLKLEGENPFLKALREAIMNSLMLQFAALSRQDTDLETSGTTDTDSSSPQSPKI